MVIIFCLAVFGSASAATVENSHVDSYMDGGVTYAEGAALASALGIDFSEKDGTLMLTDNCSDPMSLVFDIKTPNEVTVMSFEGLLGELKLSGKHTELLGSSVRMKDGKLYVPIRFVSDFFESRVYYFEGETTVERYGYHTPTLIRTNGSVRERIAMPDGFESAVVVGDELLYIAGDAIYKRSLSSDREDKYLCRAGRTHLAGDRLFVLSSGELDVVNISNGTVEKLTDKVTMVGYTYGDNAWCETEDGTFVYDRYANKQAVITGEFYNAFDYDGGRVFYTDSAARLCVANADGSKEKVLAKAAYYPDYYDGRVYYTDSAGNYRRVDVETGEDIMVYGLNLEKIGISDGEFILNYYSSEGKHRMFVSKPDGTDFRPYSAPDFAAAAELVVYHDGFLTVGFFDGKPYYVTENFAVALTDDEPTAVAGVYGEWAYYVLK